MVNRDRLEVDGIEVQLDYSINDTLSLRAQATYLDSDFANSDVPVRQRPDWRGGLALRWKPSETWLLDASWLGVGESIDSSIPTGEMVLEAYGRLDVSAAYRLTQDLSILLSIDNLLDEDYFEAIGFPSPGMRARLGLRYRL